GLDDVNVVGINRGEDGSLVQTGDVSFTKSLSDIVKTDDNTLVAVSLASDSDQVTFYTLNENSVAVNTTVNRPVSDLTQEDGVSYSGMQIEGDKLFLSYYISNPDTYDTHFTDVARVAVYSYPGFEFQEVLTDDRVGPVG